MYICTSYVFAYVYIYIIYLCVCICKSRQLMHCQICTMQPFVISYAHIRVFLSLSLCYHIYIYIYIYIICIYHAHTHSHAGGMKLTADQKHAITAEEQCEAAANQETPRKILIHTCTHIRTYIHTCRRHQAHGGSKAGNQSQGAERGSYQPRGTAQDFSVSTKPQFPGKCSRAFTKCVQ